MKHLKLFEDFSDPGFGIQILNVTKEKMESIKKEEGVISKKIDGGVGIVANKLAKTLGKDKPHDAFKKVYRCEDQLAFVKK